MSDEQSLSIEETNRLRLSLGLKPLKIEKEEIVYTQNKTEEELRQKIEKYSY